MYIQINMVPWIQRFFFVTELKIY